MRQAGDFTKLATLNGVRELTEGEPVELWLSNEGRAVVRAWNECGNGYTEIDLLSLLGALRGWEKGEVLGAVPAL